MVCIITPRGQATRTFGTFTADLEALAAWLEAEGVTPVAMEATGVYGKPVYNVLETVSSLTLWVVNAQHIKRVPGRKTDVQDAQWLADLLRHGLVHPSFIPDRAQRELRDPVRLRKPLTGARTDAINRIHKTLEASNLTLSQGASDILGASGRRVLQALIDGETDPTRLADATTGRLQASPEQLAAALRGHLTPVLRHLRETHFALVTTYDRTIAGLDRQSAAALGDHADLLNRRGRDGQASVPDRPPFPRVGGLCPRSAGKWWQTSRGSHSQGQSLAPGGIHGDWPERRPDPRDRSGGDLSAH